MLYITVTRAQKATAIDAARKSIRSTPVPTPSKTLKGVEREIAHIDIHTYIVMNIYNSWFVSIK